MNNYYTLIFIAAMLVSCGSYNKNSNSETVHVEDTRDKTQIFYRIYLLTIENKLYNITMSCLMSQKSLTNPVFDDVIKGFTFK